MSNAWTSSEIAKLHHYYHFFSEDWTMIAACIGHHTAQQCKEQFYYDKYKSQAQFNQMANLSAISEVAVFRFKGCLAHNGQKDEYKGYSPTHPAALESINHFIGDRQAFA